MQQKELALCLKVLDVFITACCLWFVLFFLPHGGFASSMPEPIEQWPHRSVALAALASVAILCIGVLCWRIFTQIGQGRSFTVENANRLKYISVISLIEAVIFIVVFALCTIARLLSLGFIAMLLMCIFASFSLAIVTAALSHLTLKAAMIQDENDLTV